MSFGLFIASIGVVGAFILGLKVYTAYWLIPCSIIVIFGGAFRNAAIGDDRPINRVLVIAAPILTAFWYFIGFGIQRLFFD